MIDTTETQGSQRERGPVAVDGNGWRPAHRDNSEPWGYYVGECGHPVPGGLVFYVGPCEDCDAGPVAVSPTGPPVELPRFSVPSGRSVHR